MERFARRTHSSIQGYFCPSRPPDLTAPDKLKVFVFQTRPAALEELKTRIRAETAAVSQEELQKVMSLGPVHTSAF